MTEKEIFKLIQYAKTFENSKLHLGLEITKDKIEITFFDSVTLDIIQENLHNKTYKEVKNILKNYNLLSQH